MRILIAEDQPELRRMLVKNLTAAGYTVDGVPDGAEALAYLDAAAYDAAVLDIMMPRVDGLTVLRTLRARGSALPVLLLTARDAVADRVDGLDAGADDYLIKPFAMDELLARLRVLTRKKGSGSTNVYTLADLTVDTYLPYETNILMQYLSEKLQGEEKMLEQADLAPLSAILDRVSPIDYKPYMPEDSVLHEFIG